MKDAKIEAAEKAIRKVCAEYGVSIESVDGSYAVILRRESLDGTKRVKCVIAAL